MKLNHLRYLSVVILSVIFMGGIPQSAFCSAQLDTAKLDEYLKDLNKQLGSQEDEAIRVVDELKKAGVSVGSIRDYWFPSRGVLDGLTKIEKKIPTIPSFVTFQKVGSFKKLTQGGKNKEAAINQIKQELNDYTTQLKKKISKNFDEIQKILDLPEYNFNSRQADPEFDDLGAVNITNDTLSKDFGSETIKAHFQEVKNTISKIKGTLTEIVLKPKD